MMITLASIAQSRFAIVPYNKKDAPAVICDMPYTERTAKDAIQNEFEKKGFKGKKVKDFVVYNNVTIPSIDSLPINIYLMVDKKTTIQDLKNLCEKFVQEREWAQFHDIKNLSMKQCFFALALFLGLTACKQGVVEKKDNGLQEVRLDDKVSNADIVRLPVSADKPIDTANVPKIQLVETLYNFGEITAGGIIKHSFKFKNTGKTPLIVTDVQTTCGCTVPT